jgi:acetolactate synthase-1/2/3 large subunit
MGMISGAELFVRSLQVEGVRALFAITDVSFTPLSFEAEAAGMLVVAGRHESAEVHMADAWARATGVPAVVVGGMGPGVANLVPGVVNAWVEGIPVVVIGTQRTSRVHEAIRRNRFQYTPQLELFRPVTKFAAAIPEAKRIPEYLREAFRHCLGGRPGPVYLELAPELLREQVGEDANPVLAPAAYRAAAGSPDPGAVRRAAALLGQAARPLVLAGNGVQAGEASEELARFAEVAGAAVCTTPGARGAISERHPHCVGMANALLSPVMQEADVVVAVGTRIGEVVGYGQPPAWAGPATQVLVHLDRDPLAIGVNRPVDVALVGDVLQGLGALAEAIGTSEVRNDGNWARERAAAAHEVMTMMADAGLGLQGTPVHPARLAAEFARFLPDEAIVCLDGGNSALWAHMALVVTRPRSLLWTGHFGHLGTGLPYAIGAKLACPDRPVFLFSGDGAFGFNLQELETAARVGAAIVAVVNCDYAWAMEEQGMLDEVGRTIGVEMSVVRYDRVAEGLGCHGELVDTPDGIVPALERAIASGRPAVVQVVVDHAMNVNPPGMAELFEMYNAATT